MTWGARRYLGLMFGEHGILAAEARMGGKGYELKRAAEFVFPEGLSLDEPVALGRALRKFLRAQHFSAANAVAGIPARWCLTKDKTVPSADAATLADLLRLEAERDFATPPEELTLDYADSPATQAERPILLVAASRQKVDALVAMAETAGLRLKAITPALTALADAAEASPDLLALYVGREGAELVLRSGGRFRVLRHLDAIPAFGEGEMPEVARAWAVGLGAELRRVLALLPRGQGFAEPKESIVWDDHDLPPSAVQVLENALPPPVRVEGAGAASGETRPCAAPVALALAGARVGRLPLDFLHSRLAIRKKSAWRRKAVWATAAAAGLLLAATLAFLDWRREEREVTQLRQRAAAKRPDVKAAQTEVDRVLLARGWHDQRPRFLDCLLGLTNALPERGIWVISLAIREDLRGLVSGKAGDDKAVLELLTRLQRNPAFAEANLIYIHIREASASSGPAGGSAREVAYAIGFTFGAKPAPPKGTATRSKK